MVPRTTSLDFVDLRQLQWLLGCLLALVSSVTILFLEVEATGFLLLCLGATLAALVRPRLSSHLPRLVHVLVAPVIVLIFLWDLWQSAGLLPALTRLALLLLGYRAFALRRSREDLQLILLGLFLIVVAGVVTVSLAFAVLLVVFVVLALILLLVITLGTVPGESEPAILPGEVPAWARTYAAPQLLRRVFRAMDWRQAAAAIGLFTFLALVSALLFLIIPRFQFENSFLLDRLFSRKSRTGFSEEVRFGDVTEISRDNSVALTVDIPAALRVEGVPYFRMMVLDEYQSDGGFRMSSGLQKGAYQPERSFPFIRGMAGAGTAGAWTLYLEPGTSRHLPLPGTFGLLRFREAQAWRFAPWLLLARLRDEPLSMLAYQIEGVQLSDRLPDPPFKKRLQASTGMAEASARLFLDMPEDNQAREALRRLALEAGGEAQDPGGFARAATRWLAGRHTYSLSSSLPPGREDPLLRWLRSSQPGHCELFAGAFVLLARAAGHPARMVVGFHGGSWNAFSGSLAVNNSDAHAWCEVWDPVAAAWLRVDPTPGSVETGSRATADIRTRIVDTSWSARVESLRVFWYRRIVSFDQQAQLRGIEATREAIASLRRWLSELGQDASGRLSAFLKDGSLVKRLLLFLASGTALVLFPWLLLRAFRWLRWKTSLKVGRGTLVRREAGRWLRRLQRIGALEADPGLREELLRLRYGPELSWPSPGVVFRRAAGVSRRRRHVSPAIS